MKMLGQNQNLQDYPSRTERVYNILLEKIIKQKFIPGERLVERDLAEMLGVSKTPVREALGRLEKEGLVYGVPYRGVFVARISPKDVLEIYDLREVIEGLGAWSAAEKINKEHIEQLNSIIQSSGDCVKKNDLECYSSLDLKFHNLLAAISGNERLSQIMQLLRNQTRILMSTSVKLPGRVKVSLDDHKKIVEAVVRQDAKLAEKLAREHVRKTKEAILDWLEELKTATF